MADNEGFDGHQGDVNLDLKPITDFDLGIGGDSRDFVRVSTIDDNITDAELNLITWLLLEKEFSKIQEESGNSLSSCGVEVDDTGGGDTLDAVVHPEGRKTFKTQAKRYAEDLLRAVGVSLPFELLSITKREQLFTLFSSHSNLVRNENYRSIIDLYAALRRRSKFREEFQILNILGQGEFGVVYSVSHIQTSTQFAVKQIVISSFDAIESIDMALNESRILKILNGHPNIVKLHDSWLEVDQHDSETLVFYIQLELCGKSLSKWLEENPNIRLAEMDLLKISIQLLEGVKWIHENGCLHLDINPKNILWSDSSCSVVKFADFGLAVTGNSIQGRVGTVPYSPPDHNSSPKCDVYSLGLTLLEFSQNISTRLELYKRLENRNFQTNIPFLDLILPNMLRKQPSQRPCADECLQTLYDYANDK